jgi:sensor histidine kinase YesM
VKTVSSKRNIQIVLHLSAWLLLIILPQIIINRYWGNSNFIDWRFYFSAAILGLIFYINYLWLIPRFYFRKNKLPYFALAILVIVVSYYLNESLGHVFHDPKKDKPNTEAFHKPMEERAIPRPPFRELQVYYFLLMGILITGFSIGLKMIEMYSVTEKRQKELEREKLNSELAFLKNQVSPHFFFNTLNNIYSLVEINTEDAQAAILKLSKLMRYLLYESEHGETLLKNETEFMKNYMDLMQLRVSKKVNVNIELPRENTDLKIPPLLFIPFIENAFKYGISYRDKSYIKVVMNTDDEKISFKCVNSIVADKKEKHGENHSGIGLENVKKRLQLLFPGKHVLNINSTEEEFTVSLEIELRK